MLCYQSGTEVYCEAVEAVNQLLENKTKQTKTKKQNS